MSGSEGYFESEDVLFVETFWDELFQVFLEGPAIDSLMSLAVMAGAIFFYSEK